MGAEEVPNACKVPSTVYVEPLILGEHDLDPGLDDQRHAGVDGDVAGCWVRTVVCPPRRTTLQGGFNLTEL
jgi:hypothetical protein